MQTIKVERSKAKHKKHLVAVTLTFNELGDLEVWANHDYQPTEQCALYIQPYSDIRSFLDVVIWKRGEGGKDALEYAKGGYKVLAWMPDYYLDVFNDQAVYHGQDKEYV